MSINWNKQSYNNDAHVQVFKEAIKAAVAYKEHSTDFLDDVMRELEVCASLIVLLGYYLYSRILWFTTLKILLAFLLRKNFNPLMAELPSTFTYSHTSGVCGSQGRVHVSNHFKETILHYSLMFHH